MSNNKFELYLTMGLINEGEQDSLGVLEAALKGGVTCFRLREKGNGMPAGTTFKELVLQSKMLCHTYGVPLIIHDDVDLAIEVGASGVHVEYGARDLLAVRAQLSSNQLLGVTVRTASEAFEAADAGANYIMLGPVFKSTDGHSPVGLDLVREIAFQLPGLPIVGFGGISERKMSSVIRAGASGIAVTSKFVEAKDPEKMIRHLKGQALLALTGVEM